MDKKKVLLVDDVDYFIDMKMRLLKRADCDVITASNGNMALELTIKERPDLVLMDSILSGMNGVECCNAIKNDPVLKSIPVIMIVSKGQEEEIQRCLKAGCDDYVTKPLDKTELIKKIQERLDIVGREHIRITMNISAYYTVNGTEHPCRVLDLCEGGMFMLSENPLPIYSSLLLKFVVPTSQIALLALGEVTRIVENINLSASKPTVGYGVKFLKMPNVGKQIIAKAVTVQ